MSKGHHSFTKHIVAILYTPAQTILYKCPKVGIDATMERYITMVRCSDFLCQGNVLQSIFFCSVFSIMPEQKVGTIT